MYSSDSLWLWVLPTAFLLDLAMGDPQFAHHPVRYMGKAVAGCEPVFRKWASPRPAGMLMAVFLISGTWAAAWLALTGLGLVHPLLRTGAEILAAYFFIACRGLETSAMEVYGGLRDHRLDRAKTALSMIVGREVAPLKPDGVAAASVETVAENLVDGVVSPLFFAAIGGIPLMAAYKMINTLDSMIGYKNETYREFGMAAARIDDAANYLPARLSVPVIALAAQILSRRGKAAWRMAWAEGRRHASPNSGFPEAAFAGVLSVRLGGPNIYQGRLVDKPRIGRSHRPPDPSDIPRACDLMIFSACIWTLACWFTGMAFIHLHMDGILLF